MREKHYITGLGKSLFFAKVALHVAARYAVRPGAYGWSLPAYLRFLRRALLLLLVFRHNKVVRVFNGYKFQLYLPAYPSPAFFYALENKLLRTPPSPITIVLSMTKACSYKCRHCYQHYDTGADLNEEQLIDTARRIQNLGVAMFDIEGGEPFMRYPRLLKLIQALDRRSELWVNTTGAHLQPEMLRQLKSAGLFGLMVSIHSPDPDVHDALTGVPGSFDTACNTLKLCREHNLVAAMNSMLSEEEVCNGGVERLMNLARELACDYVQLIHPKPAGIWLGRKESMQQSQEVLMHIEQTHALYNSRARHDYPSLAAQIYEERAETAGCTAGGIDRFYVNAYGEVQPCEFLNISFGNVRTEPFETIFARMRACFAIPCCDWLCCKQADTIQAAIKEHGLMQTPLPWEVTQTLVEGWDHGRPTPLYKELGIYR
ncbi:MAG: radical SAM protein [bacterium]|nr:radical SAM protein [bacterium]